MPRDLVYLAPHPWDAISQRPQQLCLALAERGHRVLHVGPLAPSLLGKMRRLLRRQPVGAWRGQICQVQERLWTYTPPATLPLTMEVAAVNRLAHHLVLPQLRRELRNLGFHRPLLIVGWPLAAAWAGRLGESALVYDCMDDFPAMPMRRSRKRLLARSERHLAMRADALTVTSAALAEKWARQGRAATLVPNGVADSLLTALHTAQPAPEVRALPTPLLLYIGALSRWLDTTLLAALARSHPECSLVFVGPIATDVAALRCLPNVYLLGPRPHDDLPAFLVAATVGLIPFVQSPLTAAINPVKLYQYLAAGLPVVATLLPELQPFAPLCQVAADGPDFIRAVEMALREPPDAPQRALRRQAATEHTWSRRAAMFEAALLAGQRLMATGR